MEIFSDQFGPYPYREMAVVEAPLTFRGQEFPGMNLIGSQAYSQYQTDLEMRVAHEVGHQWWYNQVGSDQTLSPWLDEGLTEFSMYYYFAKRYGEGFGDRLRQRRWEAPVNAARVNGTDAPIGRPVDFYNERNYETIIYAKSALFVASLRDEIGPQAFDQMLRTYLDTYRWQIASPEEFRALAERTAGRDLGQTFMRWLEGVAG
jgi:aminopeptidase N